MANDGWTRELKLQFILKSVEECDKISLPTIKDILLSEISKKWGCRRQTSQELLNELVFREDIIIDKQNIWTYKRWEKIKDAIDLDFLKGAKVIQRTFS